ncbi:hypothetical protein BX285_0632 [Streptomyces sp. 1114.5]|uniref:hypothetical protein n=1 Tax=unclassified Streptomyces TaxID=2593676 RepID=UPI000BD53E30|nr:MULTISPECIES: hypothetical protein [unclassified Streptomyces]RKT16297.1 hypothetical protein BX285_0632 [Streptomyces sp. 1114.5]SOB82468.1 hypothetical protein SAMN06272789_2637 [Streptomyces sp. 1331.2]
MKLIRTHRHALALASLAAVGTLTLTACNDDASSSDTATTPSTAPSAPATGAASPSSGAITPAAPTSAPAGGAASGSAAAPAPAGPTAAPGTTVKVGDAVTIPFSSGSTKGTIALSVTSIEKGDPADLASLNLGDKAKGLVPYYIHYKVTNAGSTDLSFTSVDHMKGLLADGTEAQDLLIIGSFPKCKSDSLPKGFTNGQSATSCAVAMSPEASKVAGAEYWGDPYTLGKGVNWK